MIRLKKFVSNAELHNVIKTEISGILTFDVTIHSSNSMFLNRIG